MCILIDDIMNSIWTVFKFYINKRFISYSDFILVILQMLHRLGARRLAVVGVPPMGCMPLIKYLRGQKNCIDQLNQIAFSFNSKIVKNLELLRSEIGLKTIYVDAYSTITEAIKNPKKFGDTMTLFSYNISMKYNQ